MSRSRRFLVTLSALSILCSCMVVPFRASAAVPSSASFTVSPAVVSLTVSTETPTQSATITVTNQYSNDLRLSAELYGIDESAARIVPTGKPTAAITSAVSLSAADITIPAHSYQTLTVTVTDSAELLDGGHYAALVLSEQSDNTASSLFRSAASIPLFIVKDQNIRTNLQLAGSSLAHTPFTFPSSGIVTLRNQGNTRIVPRGSVSIYAGDTLVGKAVINTESQGLFPTKQAEFTTTIERYGRLYIPHKLRAVTMYRIDGSDVELMKQSFFWYIPIIDLVGLAVLAAVLYGAIRNRRRLVHIVQLVFRRKHSRPRKSPTVKAAPMAHADTSTKSTIGQVVLEAETQQAELPREAEPMNEHEMSKPSEVAKPAATVSIPRRINVVSLEEPTVRPKKVTQLVKSTSPAKKKVAQTKPKQPKKATPKASTKTAKPNTSSAKASKATKTVKKRPTKSMA